MFSFLSKLTSGLFSHQHIVSAPTSEVDPLFSTEDMFEPTAPKGTGGGLSGIFKDYPALENAGKFDSLADKASEVFEVEPQTWTGIQFSLQNVLSPDFVTVHSLALGKKENIIDPWGGKDDERSLYSFTSFLRTKHWTLNGRWSTGNTTRAVAIYERKPFSAQISGQFSEDEKKSQWEAECSLTGKDMCTQFKLQGPAIAVSYTQPLWKNIVMGSEVVFSAVNGFSRLKWLVKSDNKIAGTSMVGSFSTGSGSGGAGSTSDSASLTYVHRVFKSLDFVTSYEASRGDQWSSSYKVGYNLKNSEQSSIRGYVDSSWKVVTLAEEPLSEAIIMQVSGKVDVVKNAYDFGIGFLLSM